MIKCRHGNELVCDRVGVFGALSRRGLRNHTDHGLVKDKGFSVPAAHSHTKRYTE